VEADTSGLEGLSQAQGLASLNFMDKDENFCGSDGSVLTRPPPLGVDSSNAKGKYWIRTFGCQMNLSDSERMAGVLETMGYMNTEDPDSADLLVYNTCSIRDKAEQKVYSALGRQAKRKRDDPNLRIVVAGCVAQQEGNTLLRRVPEVDLVMGPQFANRIDQLLEEVDQGQQVCRTENIEILEDITVPRRNSDISAWVNIIYGCNEHCTYCVVPTTRGQEQSRTAAAVRQEIEALAQQGFKEVTLLGQNVDAYGRDLPGFAPDGSGRRLWTFTDLLRYIHDVPGIERIRYATSHPRYFTERLIKTCAELPKIMPFYHIPFQSGDNDVLREMKRGYTHQRYRRIIDTIRHYDPHAAVSGDAIAGFPGETEEQFQRTMDLVREVGFDVVNTAAYSPRPNTPAAHWENQVADLIKLDRLHRLNDLVNECAGERSERYVGTVQEILVDGANPKDPTQMCGRTPSNRLTFFEGGQELYGKLVKVHIDESRTWTLTGHVVE